MMTSLILASALALAAQDTVRWTAYVSNQTARAPWGRTVRGPSQFPRFGFDTVVSAVRALPPEVSAIVNIGGPGTNDVEQAARFFAASVQGDARAWRDTVAARAEAMYRAAPDMDRLVWQISNEINSRGWSRAIAGHQGGGSDSPNDPAIIPVYVEHVLAPAVAELRAWSATRLGDSNRVRLMLGSVANAANPRSREWLDRLLSYRVAGTTTPALRGREVAELVDLVSVHYLVTAATGNWQVALDDLWQRTVGRGRVRGIWATEELGAWRANSGLGAATAVRVTTRWLSWARPRWLTPQQVRWSFWGSQAGPAGSQGRDGMSLLLQVLGDSPVWPMVLAAPPGQEHYLLEAEGLDRRALVVFGSDPRGRVAVATVTLPRMPADQARAWLLDEGRIDTLAVRVRHTDDSTVITFAAAIALRNQAVLLVSLGRDR